MEPTVIPILQQKLHALGPLPPAAWEALVSHLVQVGCRRGRSLPVQPGDLYYIISGLLKEEQEEDDQLQINRFLQAGDALFAPQRVAPVQYVAIEATVLLRIGRPQQEELHRQHPELSSIYSQLAEAWLAHLSTRMHLLSLPKHERYGAFKQQYPGLASRLLDKELMAYLVISRSYFSENK